MSLHDNISDVDKVKSTLSEDKTAVDAVIANFLENEFPSYSAEFTDFSRLAMDSFGKILSNGGKRLRASLLINSYKYFGGEDTEVALRTALAVEMVHAYLLVIDDFADVSLLRRGSDSAHMIIEKYAEANNLQGDLQHFGYSVAVTAGIAGMHIASNIIGDLNIDEKIKNDILRELNKCVLTTANGQINDMYNEVVDPDSVCEESIINVMKWKTAQYTFFNPIQIGAMLAGVNKNEILKLYEYTTNAGLAFQIQDDIIGMFGKEEDTGKPTIDDLREGKITLLMANTFARVSEDDKKILMESLGNHDVTEADHQIVKELITKCKALDATTETAISYSQQAIECLEEVSIGDDFKEYLVGIAKVIVARDR